MHSASNNVKLTLMFYYQGSPIYNLIKSNKWTKTWCAHEALVQDDTIKRELLKNPTKIEEMQQKKNLLTKIEPLELAF